MRRPMSDDDVQPESVVSEASYEILTELRHKERCIALVRDQHEAHPSMTRLAWWKATIHHLEHEGETVSWDTESDVSVRRGSDITLDARLTVREAIDAYAPFVREHSRETYESLDLDRRAADEPGELRDPSADPAEALGQAAEEVIRASFECLWRGAKLGPARHFYEEIIEAAGLYPAVMVDLLWEAQLALRPA
jgi:hypothetical protein